MYDLIIIGAGASGFSAGIYAGRYLLKTLILGDDVGGVTNISGDIENYPGFKSIEGYKLMELMQEQVAGLGVEIIAEKAIKIERQNQGFLISTAKNSYETKSVIFASGTEWRKLGLANEEEMAKKGLHYCVVCDGPLYKNKIVGVVGGGDSAVKGVNLLSGYAKKIYLIVRDPDIIAEPINYERMMKIGDKLETLMETEVKEIIGNNRIKKVIITKPYQGKNELVIDGLFVEIGSTPRADLAKSLSVELDERGYIKVDNGMRTNIAGVFASGDIVNFFGPFKQIVTATATGSVAATSAYEYLQGFK